MKSTWRYGSLLAVFLLPLFNVNAEPLQAKQYADFDRYVLALSWQTGFVKVSMSAIIGNPKSAVSRKRFPTKLIF